MFHNANFTVASNHSHSHSHLIDSNVITEPLDIFALVFMAIIFILGVSGNLFTVYVISVVKRRPSSAYDLLVIFLSISDLICVVIVPAIFAYGTITHFGSWVFGLIGCKVLLSVLPVNVTVSQGILILMSIDRYLSISKPFRRSGFSKQSATLYVILTIVIAVLLVSPRAYSLELNYDPSLATRTCTSPGSNNRLMLSYASINFTRDIISTVVLAASGRKLYEALTTNSSNMAKYGYMGSNFAVAMSYVKQTHRLLRLILIAFSICTIPLDAFQFCVYLYFQFGTTISSEVYVWIRSVNTVLYLCQTSNAVVNVFIYGTRHRDFKPVLRRISKMRMEFLYKVFPRAQGANLEDGNRAMQPATISHRSERNDIQVLRMVQFGFDGCLDTIKD